MMNAMVSARVLHAVIGMLLLVASSCRAGERITDEALRLKALRLAFPQARITAIPGQRVDRPFEVKDPANRVIAVLKDALGASPVYEVVGPVSEKEKVTATDVTDIDQKPSDKRRVRMELYRWRVTGGEQFLLCVLSYSFDIVNPARCCSTAAKILLLPSTGDRVFDVLDKTPYAFTTFTSVEFFRVDGSGAESVMIGADYSYVGSSGVSSVVFDVVQQRLQPVMSVSTMVMHEAELENADVHTLALDKRRTRGAGGARFFFVRKSYVDRGKILDAPVTSVVSFPVGVGLPLDWQ